MLQVEVPERAAKIFESSDTYRMWISSLDLICTIYNKIKRSILPVEEPLVKDKLNAVVKQLERGKTQLNWRVGGCASWVMKHGNVCLSVSVYMFVCVCV
jgi:dynein heavy chain